MELLFHLAPEICAMYETGSDPIQEKNNKLFSLKLIFSSTALQKNTNLERLKLILKIRNIVF